MNATVGRAKPWLRAVFHELGFYAALGVGAALVLTAVAGRARSLPVLVSALSTTGRPGRRMSARGSHAKTTHVCTCSSRAHTRRWADRRVVRVGRARSVGCLGWRLRGDRDRARLGRSAETAVRRNRPGSWLVGRRRPHRAVSVQRTGLALILAGGAFCTSLPRTPPVPCRDRDLRADDSPRRSAPSRR